jgi:hypothetical protein
MSHSNRLRWELFPRACEKSHGIWVQHQEVVSCVLAMIANTHSVKLNLNGGETAMSSADVQPLRFGASSARVELRSERRRRVGRESPNQAARDEPRG